MAVVLTAADIAEYRQQLADSPEALETLELIEAMDGNLAGAMGLIAPQYGIEFTKADSEPLEKMAQRFSEIICDDDFDDLMKDLLAAAIGALAAAGQIPVAVATPIVLYLAKKGVKKWCQSQAQA